MATIDKFEDLEVLYRSLDSEYIIKEEFEELYSLTDKVGKMLSGLTSYLNKSEYKGERYKNSVIEPTEMYGIKTENLNELISIYYSANQFAEEQKL